MNIGYGDKFGPATIAAKTRIKAERIVQGYDMNYFAALLGISRKKLEDIEATRNYGCFLDLEMMNDIAFALNEDINFFVEGQ
jgi:transcriptional regulator with XRE-family HTH domain